MNPCFPQFTISIPFPVPFARTACLSLVLVFLGPFFAAKAADATWTGSNGSGSWPTANNWSGASVPGSGDTATFNGDGNGQTTISMGGGGGITIQDIVFDTSSAAAYTLGSNGGQSLTLNDGGGITINSSVTTNQTILARLTLGTTGTTQNFTLANNSATALLSLTGTIFGSAGTGVKTLTVTGSGNTSISGALMNDSGGGTLKLVKDGTGTLTLENPAATNTASGGLEIKEGRIISNITRRIVAGSDVTIGDGTGAAASAVLQMNQTATNWFTNATVMAINSDGQWDLNGKNIGTTGAINVFTVNFSGGGSIVGNGNSTTGGGTLAFGTAAAGASTINITFSGSGSYQTAGGDLIVSGLSNNDSTVRTTTLTVRNGASIGTQGGDILLSSGAATGLAKAANTLLSSSGTAAVDTGEGWLIFGTGDTGSPSVADSSQTIRATGNLSVAGQVAIGRSGLTGTAATNQSNRTLTVDANNAAARVNVSARIADGDGAGVSNNGVKVTGLSGSRVTFSGSNTYTGGTLVEGTLLLVNNENGSGTGSGSVTVAGGAQLGGNGTIAPEGDSLLTFQAGAILAPGTEGHTDVLTIDASATTLDDSEPVMGLSGAELAFNLGSSLASSRLNLTGSYLGAVSGLIGNTFNFVDLTEGALAYGRYTLIQTDIDSANPFTGLSVGTLEGFAITGLSFYTDRGDSVFLELAQLTGTGDYAIQLGIVPEPQVWALILGGVALLAVWKRRSLVNG